MSLQDRTFRSMPPKKAIIFSVLAILILIIGTSLIISHHKKVPEHFEYVSDKMSSGSYDDYIQNRGCYVQLSAHEKHLHPGNISEVYLLIKNNASFNKTYHILTSTQSEISDITLHIQRQIMIEAENSTILRMLVNVSPSALPGRHLFPITVLDSEGDEKTLDFYVNVE